MEFSLRPDETLPDGLRRVVVEQLETAAEALHSGQSDFDGSVHEARKAFKRIRGALRLVRGELGSSAFKSESRCFRDAGRELAAARDAFVLRVTLSDLAGTARDPWTGSFLSSLAQEPDIGRDAAELWRSGVISELQETLGAARSRLSSWSLEDDSFDAIRPGLLRTYRQGRNRMRRAFESGDERAYHAWRRRVKDLWYQLQLLEPTRPDEIGPLVSDLDALGENLGTDHDLAMAAAAVRSGTDDRSEAHRVEALGLIEERTAGLRDRARTLGTTIYRSDPAAFVARIESCWRSVRFESNDGDGESEPELIKVRS